jgi:hypothetical protein
MASLRHKKKYINNSPKYIRDFSIVINNNTDKNFFNTNVINDRYVNNYSNIVYNNKDNIAIVSQNGRKIIDKIEKDVFAIIEAITLQIELDKVCEMANTFYNSLKSKSQMLELVDNLEDLSLSIICNIVDKVELGIINCRIQYLKEVISKLDPDCVIEYDKNMADTLLDIFNMISNSANIDNVKTKMENIYNILHQNVLNEDYIKQAEDITIGIFQNIADRVDLGIISCRLMYLQNIISKIDNECLIYDSTYSKEIVSIIEVLSKINYTTGNNGELETVCNRIQLMNNTLSKRVEFIDFITEAEGLILSIICNIVDRVDLGIVSCRLMYLQAKIKQISQIT